MTAVWPSTSVVATYSVKPSYNDIACHTFILWAYSLMLLRGESWSRIDPALHVPGHQSPGYFDHVSEVIVIIFKTYFENNQNILTSSSSMGFLPIKLIVIIISTFLCFFYLFLNICVIIFKLYCAIVSQHFFLYYNLYQNKWCHFYYKVYNDCHFIVKCIKTYFICFEYKLYNDCLHMLKGIITYICCH
jgi:hypothetical protein